MQNKNRFRFRIWWKKEKCWVESMMLCNSGFLAMQDGTDIEDDDFNEKDLIIQQCTGLKDRNGKLIYEGDIIKIPTQCNKKLHGNYSLQEVVWRNGYWVISYISSETGHKLPRGWTAGFLHNYWSDEFEKEFMFSNEEMFCKYDTLEVIGNIYENPELLKEK